MTATISRPGVYDLPMAAYLADPAPMPSLNAGCAHLLLERSPWHAYCAHPRLGAPDQVYRRDGAIGTVFHALFLGAGGDYTVIDCDDFRTKAAREQRDDALAQGKTPIKTADCDTAEAMVEAAVTQLERHEIGNFADRPGKAEQTLLWQEPNGIYCRACVDWLPDDLETERAIIDIKTSTVAHPDVWSRRAFGSGYDLSAAHYLRGIQQLLGVDNISYRFVVVENRPPYALSVIDLSPGSLHLAEKRRAAAVNLWKACLDSNRWPGYAAQICTISIPPYLESQQIDREIAERWEPEMLERSIAAFAP